MTKRSDFEIEGFVVGDLVQHVHERWHAYVTGVEMHGDRDGFEVVLRIDGPVFEYYSPSELHLEQPNPQFEDA